MQEINTNLLGEDLGLLNQDELEKVAEEEAEVLYILRLIAGWRNSADNTPDAFGYYRRNDVATLYFDMDNIWIQEEEDGEEFENCLNEDSDNILAVYRFLRGEPMMNYPYLDKYLEE